MQVGPTNGLRVVYRRKSHAAAIGIASHMMRRSEDIQNGGGRNIRINRPIPLAITRAGYLPAVCISYSAGGIGNGQAT
jgi:hypothetical protein